MMLGVSAEQDELRASVRRWMADRAPLTRVRELMDTEDGLDRGVWEQAGAQLGLQGLAIPEEYGGSGYSYIELIVVLAVQPTVPELAHRVDDREQRLPFRRQLVLDPRRRLRVAAAVDDAFLLEPAQTLGERPGADAGAGMLELGEAASALGEVVHQECRPLRADDLRRAGDRAGRGLHRPAAHSDIVAAAG